MKRLITILTLGVLLFSLNGKAQTKQELKALKYLEQHDLPRAMDQYERLAEKGNQKAMEQLGRIYFRLRNYQKAGTWFNKARSVGPLSQDALFDRASLLLTEGEIDSAITAFFAHAKKAGDDPRSQDFGMFLMDIDKIPVDSQSYQIKRVPFNSPYSEFGPTAYKDGLIFCSERPNAIAGVTYVSSTSETPLLNLYFTRPSDSTYERFSKPRNIDWGLSTKFHEGPVAVANDSSVIYFTRSRLAGKGDNKLVEIHRAERKGGGWGASEVLKLKGFENRSYGYPSLSQDGNTMYFAGKTEGEDSNWDLYAVAINRRKATPVNLGSGINTKGNESMPFIHPDGTLYFSSDGHPGYGGMDLFYSVNRNGQWSSSYNLGRPVNSSYDDFSCWITEDKKNGFFASNRDSRSRNDDIYQFQRSRPVFTACEYQEVDSYCYLFYDEGTPDFLPEKTYFEWNMGDGTVIRELKAKHCFPGPGTYLVELNIVDSITGDALLNQSTYEFEIEKIVQPFITSSDTHKVRKPMDLHAMDCNMPQMDIQEYYWEFGDGAVGEGEAVNHTYKKEGKYTVQLGITGIEKATGRPMKACVLKDIEIRKKVGISKAKEVTPEPKSPDSLETIFEASEVDLPNYRIQLGTSLSRIGLEPENFRGLEGVIEIIQDQYYRYIYGREEKLDSAFQRLREVQDQGFDHASVLVFEDDSLAETQPFVGNWLPAEDFDFTTIRGRIIKTDTSLRSDPLTVIWEDLSTGKKVMETQVDPQTGSFLQDLPKGTSYVYFIKADGYYPLSRNIDLKEPISEMVVNDTLKMVSVQEMLIEKEPFRMNNVFFDYDKSKLKPESYAELKRIARFMKENPKLEIEISGHTDSMGDQNYNRRLSRERASSVAEYLIRSGCKPSRISIKGYGETKPSVSNQTVEGRKINRRVEFRVLSSRR